VKQERAGIRAGDSFLFRLKANTTRKILTKSGADGARNNGKRVPVRGEVERHAWLSRHALASGFKFGDVRITELGAKGRPGGVRLAGAVFDGALQVEDAARFVAALAEGVGPAKAYGFGLLSIRRA
jgi:CRISPR system Cascade subunit CasE